MSSQRLTSRPPSLARSLSPRAPQMPEIFEEFRNFEESARNQRDYVLDNIYPMVKKWVLDAPVQDVLGEALRTLQQKVRATPGGCGGADAAPCLLADRLRCLPCASVLSSPVPAAAGCRLGGSDASRPSEHGKAGIHQLQGPGHNLTPDQ